ncbi:hypothetical protein [Acidisphaera sp. L21]|uniref:hypothetical protein n=1 Tax=Acidisphaera sp. L21 TaxID=1641851 RepID=UPI00131C046B|nr:hypothetical protein [Acidisphaera sp. L21]
MLAERSYFHGAAALSNSLVRNGFTGHIVVGYRGALPVWGGPVKPAAGSAQPITADVDIQFIECTGDWNLSNQKPQFLLQVAETLHPDFTTLWYFDCDVVIKTAWANFARWAETDVLLVLDLAETYMPANHVFRREWQNFAERAGLGNRPVSGYFNSGCVGVAPGLTRFLDAWAKLLHLLADTGTNMSVLVDKTGRPEFAKMDQDLMNAAIMATDVPYNALGVEAMDAFPSANIMSHAMVFAKPWRRDYIHDALLGYQPDPAHLSYWIYADGPILSFTPAEWKKKQRVLKLTRWLGFLKRSSVDYW